MTLSEYLTEGIISKRTGVYRFPNKPDRDQILNFIEGHGFKRFYPEDYRKSTDKFHKEFLYELGRQDPKEPQTFWVKFWNNDGSTNVKTFFCRLDNLNRAGWADYMVNGRIVDTFEEFRNEVCEHFGWK